MIKLIKDYFKTKKVVKISDVTKLQPHALIVLANISLYFHRENMELILTSMISDVLPDGVNRVSKTHEDGRAFDISSKRMTKEQIIKFESKFNMRFRHWAALSKLNGGPTLIVLHSVDNSVTHIHVQVRPWEHVAEEYKNFV